MRIFANGAGPSPDAVDGDLARPAPLAGLPDLARSLRTGESLAAGAGGADAPEPWGDRTPGQERRDGTELTIERLKLLFNYAPYAYYLIDLKGRFLDGNAEAERLLGYRRSELIGKSVFRTSLLAKGQMTRAAALLAQNLKGRPTGPDEFLLTGKDGRRVQVEIRTFPLRIEGQTLVVGIANDITRRKKNEDELTTWEKRFEMVISASGQVVYDYDPNTGGIDWSGGVEQVLGYSPEAMGGIEEWTERIHPDDRDEAVRRLEAAEKAGLPYDVDYRFRHGLGGYRWVHDRGSFLVDEERGLRRMIGMMQDISERKQADLLQTAVYRIAEAADKSASLEELYGSVHRIVGTVMPAGNFYIALHDRERDVISFPYFVDEEEAAPEPCPPGKGLTEYVIQTGRSLLCDEATDRELRGRGAVEVVGAPSAIWLGVPLIVGGKTFGVMVVQHYSDPVAYGPRELRMLEYVSSQVARSIDRKRAEARRKEVEKALHDSEELHRRLVAAIPDLIIRTDLAGNIVFANDIAVRASGVGPIQNIVGRNVFDFVVPEDRAKAVQAARAMFDQKIGPQEISLALGHKERTQFEIDGAVLRDPDGSPYGIVYLCRDITERKRAETGLREGLAKLRSTLKASIDSLASAIEMRDPYTAGHQERVTRLARAIAVEMGLGEDRIEAIEIAGVIHDLGKLYVPAEILSKPTKLTELEYAMIKMHAQAGYTILSKIDFPWPIAQIVHQHHELVNGSGYPQGLSGKEILLEAKILCVADVVEAMSSHRPYRPALGIGAALEEVAQKRGILYDREVVDACLRLFRERHFKFD